MESISEDQVADAFNNLLESTRYDSNTESVNEKIQKFLEPFSAAVTAKTLPVHEALECLFKHVDKLHAQGKLAPDAWTDILTVLINSTQDQDWINKELFDVGLEKTLESFTSLPGGYSFIASRCDVLKDNNLAKKVILFIVAKINDIQRSSTLEDDSILKNLLTGLEKLVKLPFISSQIQAIALPVIEMIACTAGQRNRKLQDRLLAILGILLQLYPGEKNLLRTLIIASQSNVCDADHEMSKASAYHLLSLVFYIDSALAASIFMDPSFIEPKLTESDFNDVQLISSLISVLLFACNDSDCRQKMSSEFKEFAQSPKLLDNCDNIKIPASVLLLKVSLSSLKEAHVDELKTIKKQQIEHLTRILIDFTVTAISDGQDIPASLYPNLESAIEGLGYSSFYPDSRDLFTTPNNILLRRILEIMKISAADKDRAYHALVFSCLTILDHLTEYPPSIESQNPLLALNSSGTNNKEEESSKTLKRCTALIELDAVKDMCDTVKVSSANSLPVYARLIRNVSVDQKHRSNIVQQGGHTLALWIYTFLHYTLKQSSNPEEQNKIRQSMYIASSALAKLVAVSNPALLFTQRSPVDAVGALRFILESKSVGSQLDDFEALLALTNLASLQKSEISLAIIRPPNGWDVINDLLVSGNEKIETAAIELICNLVSLSSCAAHFYEINPKTQKNNSLQILLSFTTVDNEQGREAAAGALATLLLFKPGPDVFLSDGKNIDTLLNLLENNITNKGIIIRGLSSLESILSAETNGEGKNTKILKDVLSNEKSRVQILLQSLIAYYSKSQPASDVTEILLEIVRHLSALEVV